MSIEHLFILYFYTHKSIGIAHNIQSQKIMKRDINDTYLLL